MEKVLLLAHMGQMIAQFNKDNIKILKSMNFEVHIAANFLSPHNTMTVDKLGQFCEDMKKNGVFVHQVDFERGVGTLQSNIKVWHQLNELLKKDNFLFIHCQSPLGGVFGRILGHKYATKVVYTAHGFHFFKGSPKKNWLVYYPIEKYLSRYTDVLVTINEEDYEVAKSFKRVRHVFKIPGVGVDTNKIRQDASKVRRTQERKKFGIPKDAFVIMTVGELSQRKNQLSVLRALEKLHDESIYYILCGVGSEEKKLKHFVYSHGMDKQVIFAGYQEHVGTILGLADCFVFVSLREGLGLAGVEAMAAGLPLVASNVNGILEYAHEPRNGYLVEPKNIIDIGQAISKIKNGVSYEMRINNIDDAKKFDKDVTNNMMRNVVYPAVTGE